MFFPATSLMGMSTSTLALLLFPVPLPEKVVHNVADKYYWINRRIFRRNKEKVEHFRKKQGQTADLTLLILFLFHYILKGIKFWDDVTHTSIYTMKFTI